MPDLPQWARPHVSVMEAMAALNPHVEVVLHDLERDVIVFICNGFSGRTVGEASLLSELPAPLTPAQALLGPYEKVGTDGRRLLSASAVILDEQGDRRGLLCINVDQSPVDDLLRAATVLAGPAPHPRPPALFERDWREQIALLVDAWCRERHRRRDQLTRADRLELIGVLDGADLFATRHASQHAAQALDVSRATVYALLQQSRAARRGEA